MLRRRMRRDAVLTLASRLPSCIKAIEACCGAHHMGRALAGLGNEIRPTAPEYVRPYVKAQSEADRKTIRGSFSCRTMIAMSRPSPRRLPGQVHAGPRQRFVELKSEEQLDVQTMHRVRDRLVSERTSLTNQIRSLLLERGHIVAQGHAKLRSKLTELLHPDAKVLSSRMAFLLEDMRARWAELDRRIAEFAAMAMILANGCSDRSTNVVQRSEGDHGRDGQEAT